MVALTQSSDIINQSTGDALDFDLPDETWTISPGVIVSAQSGNGVADNSNANNTLFNYGRIYGGGGNAGVAFENGDANVFNAAGAEIYGTLYGVIVGFSGNATIRNFGIIISTLHGIEIASQGYNPFVNNHGYIFGDAEGIRDDSRFAGGSITNSGVIRSNGLAIDVVAAHNILTQVTNTGHGVIEGVAGALVSADGQVRLVNNGTMIGEIKYFSHDNVIVNRGNILGDIDATVGGDEFITNHGRITGTVQLGGGNNVFDGTGGTSGVISAGGNDRIIAGNGNVRIHVGAGNDTLTAGPGHDRFIFDSALGGQVETFTNFNPALDRIVLSQSQFAAITGTIGLALSAAEFHLGAGASTASHTIIYDRHNGFLYYDPDGSGPAAQVHFATIANHLALQLHHIQLSSADFIVGA